MVVSPLGNPDYIPLLIHVTAASSSLGEMVPRLHDVKDEFNDDEGECLGPTKFKPEKTSFKDEEEMMVSENTRKHEEDLGKTCIEALVDGCLEAWKKEVCYDEVKYCSPTSTDLILHRSTLRVMFTSLVPWCLRGIASCSRSMSTSWMTLSMMTFGMTSRREETLARKKLLKRSRQVSLL